MKKTYRLLTNNNIEILTASELLARMEVEEGMGFHIRQSDVDWADFVVYYW